MPTPVKNEAARHAKIALKYVGLTLTFYPLGVCCHEWVGHGLVGVACGGRIAEVEILTFRVWPEWRHVGWSGRYGECDVVGVSTPRGEAIMALGGAMSTFCVAAAATALLWLRRWGSVSRPILITLSLWWIDLMTYTLPSWGLHRSIFWGQSSFSEPYEAARSLGIPGPLFQTLVVVCCTALVVGLVIRLYRDARMKDRIDTSASN